MKQKKIEKEEKKDAKIYNNFAKIKTIFAFADAIKHFTRNMKMANSDQIQLTEVITEFLPVNFNQKTPQYGKRNSAMTFLKGR